MARREPLVLGVNLVQSFLVDEEVSVDGDDRDDGAVVEHLLLDALLGRAHTVVRDLVLLAVLGLGDAVEALFDLVGVVGQASLIHKSIDLGVVQSPRHEASLALAVDGLVAGDGGHGRQNGELLLILEAEPVIDGADGSNRVRSRAVA